MSEEESRRDKLKTAVYRTRLARLSLQILLGTVFLFMGSSLLKILFLIALAVLFLYTVGVILLHLFHHNHLFQNPLFIIPDALCTTIMLIGGSAFLFYPFALVLTAEIKLDRQGMLTETLFITATGGALLAGGILTGDNSLFLFLPAALMAQIAAVKLLVIQDGINKGKYEYMKKLVDNKNKLLSTLTHELRTPLAVIKTSNELIMEERPGPLNETQKSLIHSSLENTKRLYGLIENILSQVKVEFAWFTMKQQILDIRPLIKKTALDIKPYLDTRKQTLKYSYPSLLSKTVGDRRWLEQVLLNLIHNGSKNSPSGSAISIRVQENEQFIVVSVHDRGSGIESWEIPHIFNEFYQSTDPAKDLTEGAGLGLTIVKDIIEKHKGEVYISSQPQTGTTVSFTLPLYKGVFSGTNHSDH
ncbi:MAG: HAMP domain-containing histidine kinase [Spirochaetales bacterium]|nr:HAMP domain-containing histidine kinase [Spirochaetales bacterium]